MSSIKELLRNKNEFKNYRDLCNNLNLPIMGGNAKKKQLEELSNFCKYRKEGNKFIIEEIFSDLETETKSRKKEYGKLYYIENIENIILGGLYENREKQRSIIGKNTLLKATGLINCNFQKAKEYEFKFTKYLEVNINCVLEYFDLNTKSVKTDLEKALKNLKNRNLITYDTTQIICKVEVDTSKIKYVFGSFVDELGNKRKTSDVEVKGEKVFTVATQEEKEIILNSGRKSLEQLGFDNIQQVYKFGMIDTYYSLLYYYIRQSIPNFDFCFEAYDIVFNSNNIIKELEKRGYSNWTDRDTFSNKDEVNKGIIDKITKNSIKRQIKTKQNEKEDVVKFKKYLYRTHEQYLSDVQTITNSVIKNTTKKIDNDLASIMVTEEDFLGFKKRIKNRN